MNHATDATDATDSRRFILPASIKTRWFVYHSHRYGIATLMRVGFRAFGHQWLLHHFRPHREEKFHNHPWRFTTFVLWGGYTDESLIDGRMVTDQLSILSRRSRRARHTHRTRSERHTITFVHTFPRERNWCEGILNGEWYCDGEVDDFDDTLGRRK